MKIIGLKTENVKRIVAAEINPDGNMVVVGGNNAQGKSSLLDSIMMALAGKKSICDRPLRDGEKKGSVEVNLGDYIVTRTFTPSGGGTISVKNSDGAKYSSPQAILDGLTGNLTFDPVKFANQADKDQLETLKKLVGLDFTELDAKRKTIYDERTEIGRQGKTAKAAFEGMIDHGEIEEIVISDLLNQIAEIDKENAANEIQRKELFNLSVAVGDAERYAETSRNENKAEHLVLSNDLKSKLIALDKLKKEIEEAEKGIKHFEAMSKKVDADNVKKIATEKGFHDELKVEVDALVDKPTDDLRSKIAVAEETNQKFRENKARVEKKALMDDLTVQWNAKSEGLKVIDNDKSDQLAAAKFPVEGLSFDETGVTYNGVPFSQASAAERLRVSVAMGAAMNPKLKIMLIRDASLLDEVNMQALKEMSDKSDFQLWVERVGKGNECSVIIEDGKIL